jgi:hypothetical protein
MILEISDAEIPGRNQFLLVTQVFKVMHMRRQGEPHFRVFDIGDAEIFTGFFDDLADCRIVYMRDLGEQVVFNLEIQSAYQPGNYLIVGGKIGRGFQLVDGPLIFQFILVIGVGKLGMFHSMRQLEYDAQYKSGKKAKYQETYQPGHKSYLCNRDHQENENV